MLLGTRSEECDDVTDGVGERLACVDILLCRKLDFFKNLFRARNFLPMRLAWAWARARKPGREVWVSWPED